jgi:hypothetical protein
VRVRMIMSPRPSIELANRLALYFYLKADLWAPKEYSIYELYCNLLLALLTCFVALPS